MPIIISQKIGSYEAHVYHADSAIYALALAAEVFVPGTPFKVSLDGYGEISIHDLELMALWEMRQGSQEIGGSKGGELQKAQRETCRFSERGCKPR